MLYDFDVCWDCFKIGWEQCSGEAFEPDPVTEQQWITLEEDFGAGAEILLREEEPFFSWSPCPMCGSRLGGDRFPITVVEGKQ